MASGLVPSRRRRIRAALRLSLPLLIALCIVTILASCGEGQEANTTSPTLSAVRPGNLGTPISYVPASTPSPDAADLHKSSAQLVAAFVEVGISEHQIIISESAVTADEVYFTVRNRGNDEHELLVVPAGVLGGAGPEDIDRAVVSGAAVHRIDRLAAGDVDVFEIEPMQPGEYVLLCNRPGHYQSGEHVPFRVMAP